MRRPTAALAFVLAGGLLLGPAGAQPQPQPRPAPRLQAVAETSLLMEGLAQSNFRGIEKLLATPPPDVETWKFARGQALLIAETGNLLMLRPPNNPGQTNWMELATELRERAVYLARATAAQDLARSRQGLAAVAESCNRCHQTFRVAVRVSPSEPGAGAGP